MNGRDGWDSAAEWDGRDQGPHPTPRPGLPPTRKTVEVVCCPACGSVSVGKRDWVAGDAMAHWQCRDCSSRWKEPTNVGSGRAVIP